MGTRKPPDDRKDQWEALARYSGLGVEMAGAVIGTALLGQWLDQKYAHETPWLTIIFSFFGLCYVFYRIFKIAAE